MLVGCDKNREQHEQHNQHGFTIIEVALVLAIAGLIFLVVFLALPALQNSQKDTAKRQAVGQALAAVQNYESDNGGVLATSASLDYQTVSNSMSNYLGKLPANLHYLPHSYRAPVLPGDSDLEIAYGSICGTDATSSAAASGLFTGGTNSYTGKTANHTTDAAVAVKLSSGSYYCKDI